MQAEATPIGGLVDNSTTVSSERAKAFEIFDERRRSLTALIAWSGIILLVIGAAFNVWSVIVRQSDPFLLLIFPVGIAFLSGVLVLIRRRRTDLAANLLIYGYSTLLAASILFGVGSIPQAQHLLVLFYLVTLWAGLLLNLRIALLLSVFASSLHFMVAAFVGVPTAAASNVPTPYLWFELPAYFVARLREIDPRDLAVYYGIALAAWFFTTAANRLVVSLSERATNLVAANKLITEQGHLREQTASGVLILAGEVAIASTQQLATTSEQRQAVSTINAAVAELDQTSLRINNLASNVTSFHRDVQAQVVSGQQTIQAALAAFGNLNQSVQQIAGLITSLQKKVADIDQVAAEMNRIADEIGLLALNATIEAAGAGANGKRFAVVAHQVSQLAANAQAAAERSRILVRELLTATVMTDQAGASGREIAAQGSNLSQQAGSANQQISILVEQAVRQVEAISVGTEQQRQAAAQVLTMLRDLNQAAAQNQDNSQATAIAAQQLRQIATNLQPDGRG